MVLRGTQHNLLCMLVDTLTISFWALHSKFSNFMNWSAQILQNCEIGDSTYLQNSECVQYMRRECYDLQNMVGGGVRFAKYGGVGVRFTIYPSEKHLPKIGNVIHLQFTLCKIVDVFKILGCRLKICKIRRGIAIYPRWMG